MRMNHTNVILNFMGKAGKGGRCLGKTPNRGMTKKQTKPNKWREHKQSVAK